MKINFVIHDINKNGGQERSTLEIIKNLNENNDITVLSSSFADLPEKLKKILIPVGLRRPLVVKDFVFRFFSYLHLFQLKKELIHATGTCVFFADIFTIQFVQKRWKQEIKNVQYVSFFRAIKEKFQVIYDVYWESLVFWINRKRRFIAISAQVGNDLRKIYGLENVDVISHGVNSIDFFPQKEISEKIIRNRHLELKSDTIILFVGAFERKGLATLLRALKKVCERHQDWKLIIVGSGPQKDMEILAKKLKISQHILFAGPRQDVAAYYQAADLFILPSHYDPFGLVGAEALASGCPSILSLQSGCSDLINEGKNGFLLKDSTDSTELSQLIIAFLSQPQAHPQMRIQARLSVENMNWLKVSKSYEKVFQQTLENMR